MPKLQRQNGFTGKFQSPPVNVVAPQPSTSGWPLLKRAKQPYHGYDIYFLQNADFINLKKHNLLICKNGALAVFDADPIFVRIINEKCQQLLNYFPNMIGKLPFNNFATTLFLKADRCYAYTVNYDGIEPKNLPPAGVPFSGKVCVKLSGIKTKDGVASPMLKVDQIMIADEEPNEVKPKMEYRIPFADESDHE
jgi:hypothetical protein